MARGATNMDAKMTASELRRQAESYERMASKLREAAEILDQVGIVAPKLSEAARSPKSVRRRRLRGIPKRRRPDRLRQLKDFLRANGPVKRKIIEEKTDIPVGTLGGLLKASNGFKSTRDGVWSLAEDAQGS